MSRKTKKPLENGPATTGNKSGKKRGNLPPKKDPTPKTNPKK